MKFVSNVIAAMLLVSFSLVLGCQMISEMTHRESDKDAAISKAVKETFLKDKAVDLTDVNVRTTNGSASTMFDSRRVLTWNQTLKYILTTTAGGFTATFDKTTGAPNSISHDWVLPVASGSHF